MFPFTKLDQKESQKKPDTLVRVIAVSILLEIFITITLLIFIMTLKGIPIFYRVFLFIIPWVAFTQLLFIRPKLKYQDLKYFDSFRKYHTEKPSDDKNNLKKINPRELSLTNMSYIVIIFICIIIIPNLLGRSLVSSQENYLVINENKSKYIVVGKYNNSIVAVKLDKSFKNTNSMVKLFSENNININSERLGILNSYQNKTLVDEIRDIISRIKNI